MHLFNLSNFHVSKDEWHARGNLVTFYEKKTELWRKQKEM